MYSETVSCWTLSVLSNVSFMVLRHFADGLKVDRTASMCSHVNLLMYMYLSGFEAMSLCCRYNLSPAFYAIRVPPAGRRLASHYVWDQTYQKSFFLHKDLCLSEVRLCSTLLSILRYHLVNRLSMWRAILPEWLPIGVFNIKL